MFHWICPECGREIPPAVRECAACDPSSVEASVVLAEPSKVEVAAGSLAVAANGSGGQWTCGRQWTSRPAAAALSS